MLGLLLALLAVVNTPVNSVTCACQVSTCAISFPYQAPGELAVTSTTAAGAVTNLNYQTDFTLSVVSTQTTAVLTLTNPAVKCPSGSTLKIASNLPLTQLVNLNQQTQYLPQTVMQMVDRATRQIQQVAAGAVVLPPSSAAAPSTIDGTTTNSSSGSAATFLRSDSKPATLYTATGTGGTAETFASKMGQVVNVLDYGAKCDGSTDDVSAINNASNAATGGTLEFPNGATCVVGSQVVLHSGSTYRGRAVIKGKNSGWASGVTNFGSDGSNYSLFACTGCTGVIIDGLEFNQNYDNGGAYYSVFLKNGSHNTIQHTYMHDGAASCVWWQDENDANYSWNRFYNCSRIIGGATNDHGTMFVSSAGAVSGLVYSHNVGDCNSNSRKGLSAAAFTPGTISNIKVDHNEVKNCRLAGIFITGSDGSGNPIVTGLTNVVIDANILTANGSVALGGANMDVGGMTGASITHNALSNPNTSASACLFLDSSTNVSVTDNPMDLCPANCILVSPNGVAGVTVLTVKGNTLTRCNQGAIGSGAGIKLSSGSGGQGVTWANVESNNISDANAHMVYGVREDSPGNNNAVRLNLIQNASSASVSLTGANSMSEGFEHDFSAYLGAQLAAGVAITKTTVTYGATLTVDSTIGSPLVVGVGAGNLVTKLCSDGVTCAGGNTYLTCTIACAAAVGGAPTACAVTKAQVQPGTVLTWGIATNACTTNQNPLLSMNAHFTAF